MTAAVYAHHQTCRLCLRPIPDSIAPCFGSEAVGYICPECVVIEQAQLRQVSDELTLTAATNVDSLELAPPCAMCHTEYGDERRMVHIDGRMGFICLLCEPRWVLLNRRQIGAQLRHRMKL